MNDDQNIEAAIHWFVERFWPGHIEIHKQGMMIAQLIAGQIAEPAGFVESLIDPQPLLEEMQRAGLDGQIILVQKMRAYLRAWQKIRSVPVTGRPLPDGKAQFDTMLSTKEYFDDLVAKSLRDRTDYIQ